MTTNLLTASGRVLLERRDLGEPTPSARIDVFGRITSRTLLSTTAGHAVAGIRVDAVDVEYVDHAADTAVRFTVESLDDAASLADALLHAVELARRIEVTREADTANPERDAGARPDHRPGTFLDRRDLRATEGDGR